MLFEAYFGGSLMFQTTDASDIPSQEIILAQRRAGYTHKLDGKPYKT